MALLEQEATRFAESLDDYEHVSVTDIGGWGPNGFWVVVRDHRFEREYEIASHCDYWDVISAVEGSSLALGCLLRREEQDNPQDRRNALSTCVHEWVFRRQGRSERSETDRRRISRRWRDAAPGPRPGAGEATAMTTSRGSAALLAWCARPEPYGCGIDAAIFLASLSASASGRFCASR